MSTPCVNICSSSSLDTLSKCSALLSITIAFKVPTGVKQKKLKAFYFPYVNYNAHCILRSKIDFPMQSIQELKIATISIDKRRKENPFEKVVPLIFDKFCSSCIVLKQSDANALGPECKIGTFDFCLRTLINVGEG